MLLGSALAFLRMPSRASRVRGSGSNRQAPFDPLYRMGGLVHIVWPGLDPILEEPLEKTVTVGNRHHLRRTSVIDKALVSRVTKLVGFWARLT